jgi:serine/threonine-protein kinase
VPIPPKGDLTVGSTIAGRFRILGKLGEGGMGAVYKAEHTKMDRMCAIKILGAHMTNDPDALARFTREAQMSSRIDHPHAVTIYDYGETEDGLVYLAMEYIEGETLSTLLRRQGALGLERTVKIARQIGDALAAAHELNIVHRDLKPDNIMVGRKAGNDDFVKVLDFGIAKMAESEDKRHDLTQAGLVIGTPFYMSPEQVSGQKLDPRSDVYSFALIVYEMLAGSLPFQGENAQAVMISRLTSAPRPLRDANPHIPEAVEAAVMRALVRDRDARTRTADQFVGDLEDAATGRDRAATAKQGPADTVAIQSPGPPSTGGGVPAPAGLGADPYATNRASAAASGAPPLVPEPFPTERVSPSGGHVAPTPNAALPQTPFPGQTYGQPAVKKGGAGKWIALAAGLALIFVVGVGSVVAYLAFFSGGTQPPVAPTAGGGTAPSGGVAPGGYGPSGTSSPGTAELQDEAYQVYQQGVTLQKAGDLPGAIEKYRAAIAKRHKFPQAHGNLGAALLDSGRYKEALAELNTAIEQDPSQGDFYFNVGLASFKVEDYKRAADSFRKAATLGNDPLNYAYCGFALDNAGDKAAAREQYEKYLSAAPSGEYADPIREIMAGRSKAPTGPEA